MELLQPARESNRRALVPEIPLDLSSHGQGRERRELVAEVWIESLDRLDQAEVTHLHDVVERLATVGELSREEVDEVVVGVNQLRPDPVALGLVLGFLVAAMERAKLVPRNPRRSRHPYSVRRSEISLPGA